MELVMAFVFGMFIIAQIYAAPIESGLNIPHNDNTFELPALARAGFEMEIYVEVNKKYHDKLDKMKVILLPNEYHVSALISEYCTSNNSVSEHTHICMVPDELQNKNGQLNSTTVAQKIRISATLNHDADGLNMLVYLNGSYSSESILPLDRFEDLKHFSVEGVAENIQKLQFDFTRNR